MTASEDGRRGEKSTMRGELQIKKEKHISNRVQQNPSLRLLKETQRDNVRKYFVEVTQDIIDTQGISGASIRQIAKQAGYNSALIYNYFGCLDSLISLALMKNFREYLTALAEQIKEDGAPKKNFYIIWEYFFDTCFKSPQIFYYLFFKYRREPLCDIVKKYYDLFPEEVKLHSSVVERMLKGRDIYERNMNILRPLVEQGDLPPERLDVVNDIIDSYFKMLLETKCELAEDAEDSALRSKLFDVIDLVLTA